MKLEFKFAEAEQVRSFFKDILTGRDGDSYDMGRALGCAGATVYLVIGLWRCYVMSGDASFDFVGFGTGFGLIATGVGALIKLKENTEPAQPVLPRAEPKP